VTGAFVTGVQPLVSEALASSARFVAEAGHDTTTFVPNLVSFSSTSEAIASEQTSSSAHSPAVLAATARGRRCRVSKGWW
jgi:hypothetical protein